MKFIYFVCIFNWLLIKFTTANYETGVNLEIVCDPEDKKCTDTILSELYGCADVVKSCQYDPLTIKDLVVPYPLFNVTLFIKEASAHGVSKAKPIKIVKDYGRNETLLIIAFDGPVIAGSIYLDYSKYLDFDTIIYTNASIRYFQTITTVVFAGVENIDLSNRRSFSVVSKIPVILFDPTVFEVAEKDPEIGASILAVQSQGLTWVTEQIYILADEFLNGYFASVKCKPHLFNY